MDLIWFGESCFRLHSPHVSVVTDPYVPSDGRSLPRLQADVVTLSGGRFPAPPLVPLAGTARVVARPGEYEIKGAAIRGIATPRGPSEGRAPGAPQRNCVFVIEVDGLRVCHLGYLDRVPSSQQVEELGEVDLLLVPVGGHQTLAAARAAEAISTVEPRIVVPMLHDVGPTPEGASVLERFCRELGVQDAAPQQRLSVAKSHLPGETQVVVLEAQAGAE